MRLNGTNLGLIDKVGQTYSGEQLRLILTELRRRIGTVETSTTTVIGGGGSGALSNEAYVTIGASAALTNERALTGSSRISVTDAGANSTVTIDAIGAALTKVDDTNVTLTLGGSPTTALVNAASLTLGWTGQLSVARGGTGSSTALGAFNALSPLTTLGDLLTHNGTNNIRFGIGTSGQVLTVAAGAISWATPTVSAATTEPYVTIGNTAGLTNERALGVAAGTDRLTFTDNGAGSSVTFDANMFSAGWDWTRGISVYGSSDEVQVDVKGHSTQTNPVLRVLQNADGVRMFEVNAVGNVTCSDESHTDNQVRLQIRAPNTQTVNIFQVLRNNGSNNYTAFSVGGTGGMVVGDVTAFEPDVVRFQINQGSGQSVDMFRVRNTAATIDLVKVNSAGIFSLSGTTSGIISFGLQAAAGTYNFNLPTGAGSAGQPLLSGGGGAAAQTYGTLGVPGGGTGITSLATGNIPIGAGASAFTALAPGTANAVVRSNGTAWRRNLDETAGTAHIDFGTAKAIAMACDNGTAFPTSPTPTEAQWYRFAPGSRTTLNQRASGAWVPMFGFGSNTMAVATSGNDTTGTGEAGAPYLTIQRAIDAIPPNSSGRITINVAAGTYAGDVSISGKAYTGTFDISINGVEVTVNSRAIRALTGGDTLGSASVKTVITTTTAVPAQAVVGGIVKFTSGSNNGAVRVIKAVSGNTLTLCGTGIAALSGSSDTLEFYPHTTIITGNVNVGIGQSIVGFNGIKFAGTGVGSGYVAQVVTQGIQTNFYRCHVATSGAGYSCLRIRAAQDINVVDSAIIASSASIYSQTCIYAELGSTMNCSGSLITAGGTEQLVGFSLNFNSVAFIYGGTIVDRVIYGVTGSPGTAIFGSSVFLERCNAVAINGVSKQLVTAGLHDYVVFGAGAEANYINVYPYQIETTKGIRRTVKSNTDYVALVTDDVVAYSSISVGGNTVTLPASAKSGSGKVMFVKDESGLASTRNITIGTAGGNIDGQSTKVLNLNYGSYQFYSDETNWFTLLSVAAT